MITDDEDEIRFWKRHKKGGIMALTEKQRKRWHKVLFNIRDGQSEDKRKLNMLIVERIFEHFAVFCFVLFADKLFWRQFKMSPGIGWGQILVCGICAVRIMMYLRMLKKK